MQFRKVAPIGVATCGIFSLNGDIASPAVWTNLPEVNLVVLAMLGFRAAFDNQLIKGAIFLIVSAIVVLFVSWSLSEHRPRPRHR